MAAIVWPITLPPLPLEEVTVSTKPNVLVTQVDVGPPKMRRRTSTPRRFMTTAMQLTGSQKSTFDTFYESTTQGGVLSFEWIDPVTGGTATYRFVGDPPEWKNIIAAPNASDRFWESVLRLERMS